MQAIINGITVTGTPQEIAEFQRIVAQQSKKPTYETAQPWWLHQTKVTCDSLVKAKGAYIWKGQVDSIWG